MPITSELFNVAIVFPVEEQNKEQDNEEQDCAVIIDSITIAAFAEEVAIEQEEEYQNKEQYLVIIPLKKVA
ncbi:MAG: hypothetical protein N2484_09375 [Clostridia bacterium]|nr:hypothetical protein [Clostridia bacterium]